MTETTLPAFEESQYLAPNTLWEELATETARLNTLLDSGRELTPDDVAAAMALAKKVRDSGVVYRRMVTARAKEYKDLLTTRLSEIGYDRIDAYVTRKKAEASAQRSRKLNQKLAKFNSLVLANLQKYPNLANSAYRQLFSGSFLIRFPKVNSAAKNKAITPEAWEVIGQVLDTNFAKISETLTNFPILQSLPASSHGVNSLLLYARTGDESYLDTGKIKESLTLDRPAIEALQVKTKVTSDALALKQLQLILASSRSDHDKLTTAYRLLNLYLH